MQPRGRRKGPTPAPLTQMPCSVGDGGSWVCGAVSVTEEKVQVTDEDKGTFIITDKGFSVVNTGVALGSSLGEAGAGGAAGGSVGGAAGGAHHHREDCTEKHCPSCIFLAMDAAKKAGKEERIGEGAQGTVYRFPGPEPRPRRGVQPTQYVRKEVSLDRCVRNNAPVSLREPSEDMENLIAAAIEGEFNRQYHQANNRHVVRMYCARLSMEDLPCAATLPASSSAPPSLATPASAGYSAGGGGGSALFDTSSLSSSSPSGAATPTSQPPQQPQPQRRRRRPRSVQFVMEYMDHNLSDVRRLAALVEQRILNRIVAKYPCRSSLSRRHKRAEACATVGGAAAAAGLAVVAHAWEACSHTLSYPSALYYRCHHPNTRRACSCGQGDESGTDPLPDALDNASSSSTPGVLPEAVLCAILLQLACALDKLNTLAILHKDIKPSNILLNREGVIKFSDFGTSKKGRYFTPSALGETPQPSIKRVVSTSSLCGDGSGIGSDLSMSMSFTPGLHRTASTSGSREFFAPKAGATTRLYMAPELCDTRSLLDGATGLGDAAAGMPASSPTEGTVGGSTDVWALGLSMLVLTTPHRSGPWPTEMLKDAFGLDSTPFCARSFRVNAALSPELREILCRCLLYKPTKRITPVEIRERLESLERSSGIHGGCPDRAGRCFCAGGGAAAELAEAEAAAAEASSPLDGAGGLRCSPLPSFMACLLWLTQPKLEAERVRQQLQSIGLCAADEENTPADFSNWCTTTQRHLRKYFGTGPAAAAAAAAAEAAARPQQSAAAVAAAAAAAARVAAASSSSSASPPPSPPYAARRLISKPLQLSHSHTTAKVLHAAAATARPVRLEGAKPGWQRGGQRPVAALRCNQRSDVRAQFQWLVRNGNPAGTAAASAATPAAADGAEDATAAAPSLSVLGDRGFPPLSPALAARTRTSSASTTTTSSSAAASTAGTSPVRAAAAASLPYRAPETPTQRFRSSRGGSGSGGNTPGSSGASTPAAAGSEAAAVQKLRRLHDMLEAREAFLERLERDLEQFYAEDIRQFHKEMVGELRYDAYVSPLLPDDEPAAGLSDSLFFDLFEHPEEAERLIQRRAELEHEKQDRRSAHKERRAVRVASQSQVDALADSLSERGYPQADQHGCGGSAAAAAQKGAGGGGGGGGGSGVAYQGPRRATKRQTAYHTEWAHV